MTQMSMLPWPTSNAANAIRVPSGDQVRSNSWRVVEALTPEGLHDRLAGLDLGWHLFADEVRAGMTEKETELRERLLIGLDGPPALMPGEGAHRLEESDQT